jgi:hypothetical protein
MLRVWIDTATFTTVLMRKVHDFRHPQPRRVKPISLYLERVKLMGFTLRGCGCLISCTFLINTVVKVAVSIHTLKISFQNTAIFFLPYWIIWHWISWKVQISFTAPEKTHQILSLTMIWVQFYASAIKRLLCYPWKSKYPGPLFNW